jgi:hypothetical protein
MIHFMIYALATALFLGIALYAALFVVLAVLEYWMLWPADGPKTAGRIFQRRPLQLMPTTMRLSLAASGPGHAAALRKRGARGIRRVTHR